MEKFTIQSWTPEAIGTGEQSAIKIKVHGYWGSNLITIYAHVSLCGKERLVIAISHSSGGRDTNEVESDIEAEENFGYALIAAAAEARKIVAAKDAILAAH